MQHEQVAEFAAMSAVSAALVKLLFTRVARTVSMLLRKAQPPVNLAIRVEG
jgi:hypothetical protein